MLVAFGFEFMKQIQDHGQCCGLRPREGVPAGFPIRCQGFYVLGQEVACCSASHDVERFMCFKSRCDSLAL